MVTLQCFLTPEEIEENLKSLATSKLLTACLYSKGEYTLARSLDLSAQNFNYPISKIFLFPEAQHLPSNLNNATIRPREMGWLDVDLGKLFLKNDPPILTLTTIQAEDKKNLSFKPTSWLRWLKRHFLVPIKYGVHGINAKTGGNHFYSDIGYSSKALELYLDGVNWKQEVQYNVTFCPLVEQKTREILIGQ